MASPCLELDFNVYTSSQVELHKSVNCLWSWINDVQKTLVRTHLELLTALFIDVRRTVNCELFNACRKWNRAANACAGALCGRHDFTSRGIEDPVIKRLKADTDILAVHSSCPCYC